MCLSQRVFLGYASDRERLTRKTRQQHVVVGYIAFFYLCDIASNLMARRKIRYIGFLCITIPLACEHTPSADFFERDPKSTNSSEQVYEVKCGRFWKW